MHYTYIVPLFFLNINILTRCIRSAKAKYFKEKFKNYTGDMKKTLETINALINISSNYSPESIKFNNKIYYDKKSISNAFNLIFHK